MKLKELFPNLDIKGIKTDDSNNPLGGAIFGLFKASIEDYTEDNALMTVTSGKDGYFEFKQVPCGTYKVVELVAPEGYIKSDEVINVTINQGEPVDEMNVVNVDAGVKDEVFKLFCLVLIALFMIIILMLVLFSPIIIAIKTKKSSRVFRRDV